MIRAILANLAICALLLTGCSRTDVSQLLTECNQLRENGSTKDWQQIRAKLEKVRTETVIEKGDPAAAELQNFYVMSLIRTSSPDNLDEAAEVADDVQQQYPDNFLANFQYGKIKMMQGSALEAYHYLERAHQLKEEHAPTLTLLLDAASQVAAPDAEMYFKRAEMITVFKSDYKFYHTWGVWLSKTGRYQPAIRKFHDAIRLNEKCSDAYLNIAIIYDKHLKLPKVARRYYLNCKRYLADTNAQIEIQRRLRDMQRR